MANSTMKSGSFTICCISGVMGIALEVVDMMGVVDSYMMCLVAIGRPIISPVIEANLTYYKISVT